MERYKKFPGTWERRDGGEDFETSLFPLWGGLRELIFKSILLQTSQKERNKERKNEGRLLQITRVKEIIRLKGNNRRYSNITIIELIYIPN